MKRLLKWLLPALLLADVGLVRLDLLDLRDAVLLLIAVEAPLLLVGGYQLLSAFRRYRRDRSSGLDAWAALEDGLTVFMPRSIARILASEPRLFYCLARWMARRTGLREGEFSYHKRSSLDMLVLMLVLVTPVEILVIELLLQAFLPWAWLRILVLALEIYALFWILGFYASRIVLPHRLEEKGLRLRHGTFAEGFVPYPEINSVERIRRKAPASGDGLTVTGDDAFLTIGGHTDITLELGSPLSINGFLRPKPPVSAVHLAADEPERLAVELRERVGAAEKLSATRQHF